MSRTLTYLFLAFSLSTGAYAVPSLTHLAIEKISKQLLTQTPEQIVQTLNKLPQDLHEKIKKAVIYNYQVPLLQKLQKSSNKLVIPFTECNDRIAIAKAFNHNQPSVDSVDQLHNTIDMPTVRFLYHRSGNTVYLLDAHTGQRYELTGHTQPIMFIEFNTDETYVITSSEDSIVRLWNLQNLQAPSCVFLSDHAWSITTAACLSSDNKYCATGSADNTVRLWDITQPQPMCKAILEHDNMVSCVTFDHNRKFLFVGLTSGDVCVWDIQHEQPIPKKTCVGHTTLITSISISNDTRYMITGSNDGTVQLTDLKNYKSIILNAHSTPIIYTRFIKIHSDDHTQQGILTCSLDRIMHAYTLSDAYAHMSVEEIIKLIQEA